VGLTENDVTRSAQHDFAALPLIGPYRILREIGSGGMGTVFLGIKDDDRFQKRAAIKVLRRGIDTDAIVRRFRNERQILASLEHPFIATLLDGGTTEDGRPYFAMEYVEGQAIDDYCESRQLDVTARLELFRKVCSAVQHAHQNLIIHRDIKPANVLVTLEGTPKLLDFGIAKLLDPDAWDQTMAPTLPGPQLMTPEYASPEQIRGEVVTTATDVYSLGVLLYELLTGRPPYRFPSRAPSDIARMVCDSAPVRPSTAVTDRREVLAAGEAPTGRTVDAARLRKRLAGDLDNIILKALSKEPGRRYASVDQFSEDVRRHIDGRPVLARKDTFRYRAAKFVQRNRTAAIAAALGVVALLAGIVGTTWQAREARRERARAEQRFEDVRRLANAFLFEVHDAIADLPGSTPARRLIVDKGVEYLDKLARDARDRPDLTRELAGAYVKVGDVQGRPFNPNVGDTAGAVASYRKAVALYEALGASSSSSAAGMKRELALAYTRLSEVLASTGETGEALTFAKQGVALQREAALASVGGRDNAIPDDMRRELAASYSRVGDLLSATGDTRGALEHRRMSLGMMEALAASAPKDPANLRQLGVAHQKLANSLGNPNYPNVGDFPGALQELERAHAVFESATSVFPQNAMFRRNLAVVDSNMADVLLALKRPDEALERERRALATFESQAAADPTNAAAKNDVAIGLSKLAEMLDGVSRTSEAIAPYERALSIHESLAAADPGNDSLQLEIASDHNRLATAQMKLDLRTPALEHHERAVIMSRQLRAANPKNVELTVAVALALTGRGDAYAHFARKPTALVTRREDLTRAERDYAEAVDLLDALQKQNAIQGTDVKTLDDARAELEKLKRELSEKS
jgi:serine/threonine protein kinase/tetratricopeptide (TPR) repeat protein